jgi:hypothetical protein
MRWASGAAVLVVVLASGACSPPSAPTVAEGKWGRPGSSYQQFMQERYVCAQEASRDKATTSIGYYGRDRRGPFGGDREPLQSVHGSARLAAVWGRVSGAA